MPRNISFMLTTEQIRNQTKTVTRRVGWECLEPGDILNACVKCQGLRLGEKMQKLCQIRVVSVRKEPLSKMLSSRSYGKQEVFAEGFPELTPRGFVAMFEREMNIEPGVDCWVTRIEFEYLDPPEPKNFFLNETHEVRTTKRKRTRTGS